MTAKPTSKLVVAQFMDFGDGFWKSLVLPVMCHCVEEWLANFFFFVQGQLVNSLRFVDHMVSVAVIQFCSCVKAAIDDM